jgi:hypothetical protein
MRQERISLPISGNRYKDDYATRNGLIGDHRESYDMDGTVLEQQGTISGELPPLPLRNNPTLAVDAGRGPESKKTQKFGFCSALGPNRISFSHSQDPNPTPATSHAAHYSVVGMSGADAARASVRL